MVHRPADSRLLSNLLTHEKDYVRALHSQLDYGQSSLSSFSAYAAASPPPASRAIVSVTDALIGAHDALRGYVFAIEEWCEQLKMLKEMEDEVGNIARDREILVDRLIKASKSNIPKRRSILPTSNSGNSSLFSSASPSNSNLKGHQLEHLAFSNSKLNLAQNELQACETHLSEKERILVQMREGAIIGGLKSRCKALAECGARWEELGRMGLGALDPYDPVLLGPSGNAFTSPYRQKPLPDPTRPSSDLSSIAPSQSASQIYNVNIQGTSNVSSGGSASRTPTNVAKSGSSYTPYLYSPPGTAASGMTRPEADINDIHASHFTLEIKPAHAISEEDHWTPPQAQSRHSLQLRKGTTSTAEDEDEEVDGSSDTDDAEGGRVLEIHDNPNPLIVQFANDKSEGEKNRKGKTGSRLSPLKRRKVPPHLDGLPASSSSPFPLSSPTFATSENKFSTISSSVEESPRRRKRSTFLGLGALKGIFHRDRGQSAVGNEMNPVSPSSHGGYSPSSASLPAFAPFSNVKGKNFSSNVNLASTNTPESYPIKNKVDGWKTRTDTNLRKADRADSSDDEPISRRSGGPDYGALAQKSRIESKALPIPGNNPTKMRKSSDGYSQRRSSLPASTPRQRTVSASGVNMSRTGKASPLPSVITSQVAYSSTSGSFSGAKAGPKKVVKKPRPVSIDSSLSRNTSISSSTSAPLQSSNAKSAHRRSGSFSDTGARASGNRGQVQASLLSIVEGVTLQNRKAWQSVNPDPAKILFEVKAPQSVIPSRPHDDSDKDESDRFGNSNVPNEKTTKRVSIHNPSPGPGASPRSSRPSAEMQWHRLSTISASSNSEPHLPIKSPIIAQSPTPKVPLRSALRNRTPSPNPPSNSSAPGSRTTSPPPAELVQSTSNNRLAPPNTPLPASSPSSNVTSPSSSTLLHPGSSQQPVVITPYHSALSFPDESIDKDKSSPIIKEDDTASLSSAYETGHEELSSDNGAESDDDDENDRTALHSDDGHHISSATGSTVGGGSTVGSEGPPTPTPPAKFTINSYNKDTTPTSSTLTSDITSAMGNGGMTYGDSHPTIKVLGSSLAQAQVGNKEEGKTNGLFVHGTEQNKEQGSTTVSLMTSSDGGATAVSLSNPGSATGSGSATAIASVSAPSFNGTTGRAASTTTAAVIATTTGTGTDGMTDDPPPVRRKSVRVSSKPTFAPTPPALAESEDSEGTGGYEPWSHSHGHSHIHSHGDHYDKGRGKEVTDAWEDSSEEDEEYSRARQMLLKLKKKL